MRILVTGSAGFIGSALTQQLLARGDQVIGFDNLNDYYDVSLKKARLVHFADHSNYTHVHADLADRDAVEAVFANHKPERVIHLAAQAGVRYAATNPHVYVSSNVTGFLHVLEGCSDHDVEHLVFASTSSVYGANTRMPYSEHDSTEHPLTLYAATKKANEMMAHSYAHLYGLPCTGLRFFTVYGPWGRPEMAYFLFTKAILAGEPIKLFNDGLHRRAFTYVDDAVEAVVRAVDRIAEPRPECDFRHPDPATSSAPYRILNVGGEESVDLLSYVEVLEKCLGQKAKKELLPLQDGDVPDTEADPTDLRRELGFSPKVTIEVGVRRFVEWYRSYYGE